MILGLIAPLYFVIMVAVGCLYPAVDTTAGEHERGTWETTLHAGRLALLDRHRQVPLRHHAGVHRRPPQPDRDDAVDGQRPGAAAGAGERRRSASTVPWLDACPGSCSGALLLAGSVAAAMMIGRGLRAHVPRRPGDDDADHDARHAAGRLPRPRGSRAHARRWPPFPVVNVAMLAREALTGHAAHRAGADHAGGAARLDRDPARGGVARHPQRRRPDRLLHRRTDGVPAPAVRPRRTARRRGHAMSDAPVRTAGSDQDVLGAEPRPHRRGRGT